MYIYIVLCHIISALEMISPVLQLYIYATLLTRVSCDGRWNSNTKFWNNVIIRARYLRITINKLDFPSQIIDISL